MTVLIDADSLIYVIAWNYREMGTDTEVKRSCDSILRDIITLTQAEYYIGSFSSSPSFRNEVYKYAPYKGNRGEKPEWVLQWKDIIEEHFTNKHGFLKIKDLEADDVVTACSQAFQEAGEPCIICSPDKDLRNRPGRLYVPKKQQEGEDFAITLLEISEEEAHRNFWTQMVCGDGTDNVAGIPGLGEVKCKKLLDEAMDPMVYESIVRGAYVKYFGVHYGRLIFEETKKTLMLMHPEHPMWDEYRFQLAHVPNERRKMVTGASIFDI